MNKPNKTKKGIKEGFASLFRSPDRIKFITFFQENTGEHNYLDFKKEWIETQKLAKHILGLANAGGGILVIGAEENDVGIIPKGISQVKDKTSIKNELQEYISSNLEYDVYDFIYGAQTEWEEVRNKKFQIMIVEDTPEHIPFVSSRTYDNVLYKNRIYFRSKTNTDEANQDELKKIFNRRLETKISTSSEDEFRRQLEKLKILYSFLDIRIPGLYFSGIVGAITIPNPKYPQEDFQDFIVRMIEKKKEIIENS